MSFQDLFPVDSLSVLQWQAMFPLLVLGAASVLGLLVSPIPRAGRAFAFASVSGGALLSLIGLSFMSFQDPVSVLDGVLYFDRSSQVFSFVILAVTLGCCLLSVGFDKREHLVAELYPLMGFSAVGMIGLVSSRHLMMLFISLELMSLAVYVLVSMQRRSAEAAEAGLKYFLLGGAASSVFLFGVTLLYGTTGTLELSALAQSAQGLWQGQVPLLFALGLCLIAVGFLFKVGAFPFHSWVPDVYTGASTPVTGFMISGVKLAAVGLMLRLGAEIFALPGLLESHGALSQVLSVVTALTLIVGSLLGLVQNNVKRMLAYSTIAHTGYLLLGFMALTVGGQAAAADAIASYSVIYAVMNLGCFAVLTLVNPEGHDDLMLKDLAGLGRSRPVLAFALSVFLLSMAGIPPTAGFFGKYYLFLSAVSSGHIALTVLAALASVVSAAFYIKPLVVMYMDQPQDGVSAPSPRWFGAGLVVAITLVLTVVLGMLPAWVSHLL